MSIIEVYVEVVAAALRNTLDFGYGLLRPQILPWRAVVIADGRIAEYSNARFAIGKTEHDVPPPVCRVVYAERDSATSLNIDLGYGFTIISTRIRSHPLSLMLWKSSSTFRLLTQRNNYYHASLCKKSCCYGLSM